jgi:catechol 2,3-dioxygenase-like lactoylglutathione lyase family enzyme
VSPLGGLGPPVQIAYAVPDVREAARWWAATFGAGPFFVLDHIELTHVRYRGAPASFDHSSAYGQWGQMMVELVCDHTIGPSPIADVVGVGGRGLHHLACFVDDLSAAQAQLVRVGWPEALHAITPSGMAFAFHDATAELGHMIELYEPADALVGFYQRVAEAAVGWDGTDPIRSR